MVWIWVWEYSVRVPSCSEIRGAWWAVVHWVFADFVSSTASFITWRIGLTRDICMNLAGFSHQPMSDVGQELGLLAWEWARGMGGQRGLGSWFWLLPGFSHYPRVTSPRSACRLLCILVQCIWPQRAQQNPSQLSPQSAVVKRGKTRGKNLPHGNPWFLYIYSQASASLFLLLRGSCQPNSASCFWGSHLIHSPPDSPRGHQHLPREAALPEGSPEAISPASPCRKLEEQEPISLRFSHPLALCVCTSVQDKEWARQVEKCSARRPAIKQ